MDNKILDGFINEMKMRLHTQTEECNFHAIRFKNGEEDCLHYKKLIADLESLRDIRKNDKDA
jgi:hypothetical protein